MLWLVLICGLGGAATYAIDSLLAARRHTGGDGSGERAQFLRGSRRHDDDDGGGGELLHPGLSQAFADVERLEESLKAKRGPP